MAKGNGTMNDYKVVPVEPTAEMLAAGGIEMGARDEDARTVWMAMLAAAPAVQGEPVAWQVINIKYPKVEPATHNRYPDWAEGDQDLKINPLYTAPQPAEQQPAPDTTRLVEALERLVTDVERGIHVEFGGTPWLKEKIAEIDYARAAIATHRKQQEPSHD